MLGYLLTLAAMMLFGILAMVLLPFMVSLTKTSIHRCARCLNEVKSNDITGWNNMEDEVVSFEIGKFGVLLTRRHLMYLVILICVLLGIYTFIFVEEGINHQIGKCFYFSLGFSKLQ